MKKSPTLVATSLFGVFSFSGFLLFHVLFPLCVAVDLKCSAWSVCEWATTLTNKSAHQIPYCRSQLSVKLYHTISYPKQTERKHEPSRKKAIHPHTHTKKRVIKSANKKATNKTPIYRLLLFNSRIFCYYLLQWYEFFLLLLFRIVTCTYCAPFFMSLHITPEMVRGMPSRSQNIVPIRCALIFVHTQHIILFCSLLKNHESGNISLNNERKCAHFREYCVRLNDSKDLKDFTFFVIAFKWCVANELLHFSRISNT